MRGQLSGGIPDSSRAVSTEGLALLVGILVDGIDAREAHGTAVQTIDRLNALANAPNSKTTPEHLVARGHLLPLDGVRGLAILMVICSHAFESNYQTAGPVVRLMGEVLRFGVVGVDLFFVLSGLLITGILYDSLRDHGYFRKFYVRRALRIF